MLEVGYGAATDCCKGCVEGRIVESTTEVLLGILNYFITRLILQSTSFSFSSYWLSLTQSQQQQQQQSQSQSPQLLLRQDNNNNNNVTDVVDFNDLIERQEWDKVFEF
jgi:hypothetical protein